MERILTYLPHQRIAPRRFDWPSAQHLELHQLHQSLSSIISRRLEQCLSTSGPAVFAGFVRNPAKTVGHEYEWMKRTEDRLLCSMHELVKVDGRRQNRA